MNSLYFPLLALYYCIFTVSHLIIISLIYRIMLIISCKTCLFYCTTNKFTKRSWCKICRIITTSYINSKFIRPPTWLPVQMLPKSRYIQRKSPAYTSPLASIYPTHSPSYFILHNFYQHSKFSSLL